MKSAVAFAVFFRQWRGPANTARSDAAGRNAKSYGHCLRQTGTLLAQFQICGVIACGTRMTDDCDVNAFICNRTCQQAPQPRLITICE
ncbi:MAG: hypothetical protein AAFY39_03920 [Pseudomonadota bacterium]